MTISKKLFLLIPVTLLLFYGLFLTHKINLVTADLGRHIKNGEELLSGNLSVLKTNFYSYTEPDFPVENHHWLSGVIFYLIRKFFNFSGLSVFFIILNLLSFLIFFKIAYRKAGFGAAGLISLPVIYLLAHRTEIRPEMFSYFFGAIFLYLLWAVKDKAISSRWLLLLPILQIFWVNLHIYFFIGPMLIGLFLLETLISKRENWKEDCRLLALVLAAAIAACFVNPFGAAGALAPLTIFKNYGYALAENKSVLFTEKFMGYSEFFILRVVSFLLIISFLAILAFRRKKFSIAALCLTAIFGIMAWLAIRNVALFGFFALPVLAANIGDIFDNKFRDNFWLNNISAVAALTVFLSVIFSQGQRSFPFWNYFGIGLEPNNSYPMEFFKKEDIKGPIFNNYDIGGYLIFHLFPQEKVFVDNRPEAYSIDFFQKIYKPMQNEEKKWEEKDAKYNFNAIIFSHRDLTDWGQKFLIARVQDKAWAIVFTDKYVIIFLKRNEINNPIIEKYEIPQNYFRIIKSK